MKVMHLTTVDMSLELLLGPLLDATVAAGHEVVAASAAGPYVSQIEARGVRHIALDSSTRRFDLRADARTALEFWDVLRRERPDVLHTHTPKPSFYGRVLGRLAGVPAVVNTVHGLYANEDDPLLRRALVYGAEFVGGHCSHAELVHNPEDAAVMERFRLAPRKHIHRLGSGVALDRFAGDTPERRRQLRSEWRIDDHEVLVGTVARLVAEKGIPELLEAVQPISGARLVVVGGADPEKPDAIPQRMLDDAAAAGVVFAGFRPDVEDVYAALDVFVLASHREGFPRSAMEAAAAGLPIVATAIRGCRQVVTDGDNGLLVPVRSVPDLRAAIRRLVEDAGTRSRMGERSRIRAAEEFDERAVVERVLNCYSETLAERAVPGRRHR